VTGATITPLGRGRFLVQDGVACRLAYAAVDGARAWVFLDGRAHVVDLAPPDDRRVAPALADEASALASPMPATVVQVLVKAGDRVARGDLLVTLEAMKMELPVVAPRDGVVRAVLCRPRDLVQAGAPLVALVQPP
jgi:3-methylcrotonyl-CoA carboxylase alpha subunit